MLKAIYRWGVRISLFVWLGLLVLVGARFTDQNPQMLQVVLFQWSLPEVSVGVMLCITLFFGVSVGVCAFLPAWLVSKAKISRLKSKLVKAEEKAVKLQQSTLTVPNVAS